MTTEEALETLRKYIAFKAWGEDKDADRADTALATLREELTRANETIAAWAVMIEDDDARTEAQLERAEMRHEKLTMHAMNLRIEQNILRSENAYLRDENEQLRAQLERQEAALRHFSKTYPCPCGAWLDDLSARPHAPGCPVEAALSTPPSQEEE